MIFASDKRSEGVIESQDRRPDPRLFEYVSHLGGTQTGLSALLKELRCMFANESWSYRGKRFCARTHCPNLEFCGSNSVQLS